jgi:hypothetical protein
MKEKNGNLLIIIIFIAGVLIYGSLKRANLLRKKLRL